MTQPCRIKEAFGRTAICTEEACPFWELDRSGTGACVLAELDLSGRPEFANVLLCLLEQLERVAEGAAGDERTRFFERLNAANGD